MQNYILIALISYLVGSFPTAYLVVKKITGQDIRKVGSGNIGAMNTARALKNFGKEKLAIIGFLVVLIIDMAKGALAVFLVQRLPAYLASQGEVGRQFLDYNITLAVILAAFFVVLGHNYSIFLKFSGGRGAACLIGILLYLDILSLLVWGLPIILSSILAQIILEKTAFEKKINWKKISEIVKILGSQMAGRMVGLIIAPIPLYFYNPKVFLPIAAGTTLLLIKNIPRFKRYFLKEETYGE